MSIVCDNGWGVVFWALSKTQHMGTFKNSSFFFLLFLFSCLFVSSATAQQHPLFLKQGQKVKARQQSKPLFSSRIAGVDSAGFGGEPGVVWERMVKEVFPESIDDYTSQVIRLSDGAFAISGSIMDSAFNLDGIVIKFDQNGRVIWKKRLGVKEEDLYPSICATADGGLVATGPFSIDSSNHLPVVKFSSSGTIEWQMKMTGEMSEIAVGIMPSGDGGYIISGDKTIRVTDTCTTSFGNGDSLFTVIIKLDQAGKIVWNQKHFIAVSYDVSNVERRLLKLPDGYIVVTNFSEITVNCPLANNIKAMDVALLKVDNNGILKWLKKYGGSNQDFCNDIKRLPNSNLMILGSTNSVDGDLLGVNTNMVEYPAWRLILNDTGKIVKSNVYDLDRSESDFFYTACVKNDSSYIVVGISESNFNHNTHLLEFDKNGIELWHWVYPKKAIVAIDSISKNEWVFGSFNDVEFSSFGKLGSTSNITGSIYYDFNKNNIKDANEPYANKFLVTSEKSGYSRSSVAQNGWFRNDVDTGTYKTTVKLNNDYYAAVPAEKQTTFTTLFQNDTVHFALQPVAGKRDVSISLIPVTAARPGFNAKYKLTFRNNGTDTIPTGGIMFIKDSRTTLISSVPAASFVTGDSLLWIYGGLKPFDSHTIDVEVKLAAPPTLNNGDTIRYKALINSSIGSAAAIDLTPLDDTANVTQLVTGSYDPNDKQENVAGKILQAKVASGEDIQYVIRFQNTGTDTAFTVRITDTLDAKLNWNSFQMIAASHPYKMTVSDGNKITWIFNDINLPDSNVNQLRSNGFIAFKIKAKTNLSPGDYFQNKASIYFDYNLPVLTNTATTVVSTAVITNVRDLANKDMQLVAMPNPSSGELYMKLSGKLTGKLEYSVIDLYGRVLQTRIVERTSVQDQQLIPLHLNHLSAGVYYVVLRQKEKIWQQKIILQ
jgi:uncharacterized repeat protein (TIGR01451 family)